MVRLVPTLFNSANACAENVTRIPPDRHVALVGCKSSFHQTSTSTRKIRPHLPAHMHICTHAHRPTKFTPARQGPFTHSGIPTFMYTRAHIGIHTKFKEDVQKSNVKNKIQEFPDKLLKSDLRKNLIIVLRVLFPLT